MKIPLTPQAIRDAIGVVITSIAGVAGQETMANSFPVVVASNQTAIPVDDGWTVGTISDTDTNDSDKSFTVPASTERHILSIWVEYASTATVGDRQLVVEVQKAGPDVTAHWARAGVVQAASLTYYYEFAPGLADLTAMRDTDYLTTPIPVTSILKATDILRVYDNNAVAAAADDMVVHIQYADRSV